MTLRFNLGQVRGLVRSGLDRFTGLGDVRRGLDRSVRLLKRLRDAQQKDRLILSRLQRLLESGQSPYPITSRETHNENNVSRCDSVREVDGQPEDLRQLSTCPVCGADSRSMVCEYNRFILRDNPPDPWAAVYQYCVCHFCGILYADRKSVV